MQSMKYIAVRCVSPTTANNTPDGAVSRVDPNYRLRHQRSPLNRPIKPTIRYSPRQRQT